MKRRVDGAGTVGIYIMSDANGNVGFPNGSNLSVFTGLHDSHDAGSPDDDGYVCMW